jgi:thiol-disulfide isomerase/thioredoxin
MPMHATIGALLVLSGATAMSITLLAIRLLLSGLFLVAGVTKLLGGLANSRKSLTDFGVPKWLVGPASIVLPIVEISIALLLFPTVSAQIASISAFALLLIFNGAIATNLIMGRNPNCNCFGQLHSSPIKWTTFGRNGVLAVLAGFAAWQIPREPNISLLQAVQGLSVKELAVVVLVVLGLAAIAVETFLVLHTLRQNGRLLLRIEALEAKAALGQQPQMPARMPLHGLPIGAKAIPFDLPKATGGRATLDRLLSEKKPVLLISTDPNCGPCNALMPEVASWQKSLADELSVVLLSHGRNAENQAKVAEFGLLNVLVEKEHKVAEKYQAIGTPTAVLIRADGTIGSPAMGGADGIRKIVTSKTWTEAGFAAFMQSLGHPVPPPPPKPLVPVGAPAPDFTLPDLDGNSVNSASFNGTGTVLLFWNPSCGFCQKMLPQLKEWETQKVVGAPRLMLVSAGSTDSNREMGLESTVLIDDKFAVGRLYGANGTPSAVRIDGNGKMESGLMVGAPGVFELLKGKAAPNTAPVSPASGLAKAVKQK